MPDIEELNAKILAETQKLAEAYAASFPGDPDGELRAWLKIAECREATVRYLYDEALRIQRLPEPRVPAARVAWDALTLIWQHEAVHTEFMKVRLVDGLLQEGSLAPRLMTWLGTMEGEFLAALTGRPGLRQFLTRMAIELAARIARADIPEFVRELGEMDLREFFLLCAALETTARQCYARMEALAGTLAEQRARDVPSPQLENLSHELRLKRLDETFHEAAFKEFAGWVIDGKIDPELKARDCARRLVDLLPPSDKGKTSRDPWIHVVTDGGLGELFQKHDLSVVVD